MTRRSWPDPVAVGVLAGYLLDRALGDPRRHHPVAWFGTWAGWVERRLYAPSRRRGGLHLLLTAAPCVVLVAVAGRGGPLRRGLVTATVTWAALGGRSLEREALAVHGLLEADDLPGARERIRSLVGRDTREAGRDELARATVESLAENQSDAVAATFVWGLLAGAPGVVLHRCCNTLDAMVGHRSPRYARFGTPAARCDDLLNALPARASVLATALLAGRRAPRVLATVRRDAPAHPSPNAGPVEAALAELLGLRLGGTTTYAGVREDRGVLGSGRPPTPRDVPHAVRATRRIGRLVLLTGVSLRLAATWRARPRRG
ncbi:cobalamin biosynthesis protein CobD/CbiB [Kytococcus sp. Marseille-QA3725]